MSVTVITLNEEKDLPKCLQSVRDFADEIVVVDSGSTDKTVEIAKSSGARVFERKFDNFQSQKNYAAEKTTGDWIFSIDADEEVSPELSVEIKKAVESGKFEAYSIPRKNIIFGKFIRHTRWNPELDRHIWLWKKEAGRWEGNVHEEMVVKGTVGTLSGAKIHHQYETVAEFFDMMNRYSELESKQKIANGQKFSLFRMCFDPLYNFSVRFFYRLGFLDGWRGFTLSYLMAVYHFNVWIKIWQKQK